MMQWLIQRSSPNISLIKGWTTVFYGKDIVKDNKASDIMHYFTNQYLFQQSHFPTAHAFKQMMLKKWHSEINSYGLTWKEC